MNSKIKANDSNIRMIVEQAFQIQRNKTVVDLNHISTKDVTNFDRLFLNQQHRFDIASWDISNGKSFVEFLKCSNPTCDSYNAFKKKFEIFEQLFDK